MKHLALRVIGEEHSALRAVLYSLEEVAQKPAASLGADDFEVMRAMLVYIAEYPEKLHHKKESETLFPMVLARSHELKSVIKELDDQHERGESAVWSLMHSLMLWEMLGSGRQKTFVNELKKYKEFYLNHMRVEAEIVLPVAEDVLSDDDWEILDSIFALNKDPLTGHQPSLEFEGLFQKISSYISAHEGS